MRIEVGVIYIVVPAVLSLALFLLWLKERRQRQKLSNKYGSIISVEERAEQLQTEADKKSKEVEEVRASYTEKKAIYDKLVDAVRVYEEKQNLYEIGLYQPSFDFETSEEFKEQIKLVREKQKSSVSNGTAMRVLTTWTVDNSRSKGEQMEKRQIRLSLKAFNNEAEAAISNVRWNNFDQMEKRIVLAASSIDKMNKSMSMVIDDDYINLKLTELRLTHEYREKKKKERDHAADIRREKAEEERFLREAKEALKEEKNFQKLLEQAKKQAEAAVGSDLSSLQAKIEKLSKELEAAHQKSERAKSMAEQTKAGHVYVISNVGSFGEGIVKIGMTRRLDPIDRVKELGDASVPFTFDLHALIYTEDAPKLEGLLHKRFDQHRVNMVNSRKEFFKVHLDEVKNAILETHPDTDFYMQAEAQDFNETKLILLARDQSTESSVPEPSSEFPESI